MDPLILTHCGKLGDFVYAWPIAAWLHRQTGRKIHWVLPRGFGPFRRLESLLLLQEFSAQLTLADFPVRCFGCGGQPYRFNPGDYGVPGDYFNLGFRWWPNKFVTPYQAEEHGLGWDADWVLDLQLEGSKDLASRQSPGPERGIEAMVATEQAVIPAAPSARLDLSRDVLFNVRRMAAARERHCFFSGMAAILYFARLPFILYREPWQPRIRVLLPRSDSIRVETTAGRLSPAGHQTGRMDHPMAGAPRAVQDDVFQSRAPAGLNQARHQSRQSCTRLAARSRSSRRRVGVLLKLLARSTVGRALRCAPPEVVQTHAFRPPLGARGAHGVHALPTKPSEIVQFFALWQPP